MKDQKSKIAVQWAASAREVEEYNQALMYGPPLDQKTMQVLTQSRKNNLKVPEKAQHFRVLLWSKGEGDPDFLTNWVEVVPNKTYILDQDHLVPVVLMSGTGC